MVSILARASVDGAILVAAVWIVSRILRLTPATRTVLWWCAAAKFVVALAWTTPVAIPILPVETTVVHHVDRVAAPRADIVSRAPRRAAPVQRSLGSSFVGGLREWTWFAAIGWSMGLVLAAVVGVRRWRETVRLLEGSEPAPDHLHAVATDLASRLRLRRVPDLRISHQVETPLVTGFVRPVVLLPAVRFDALTGRQQQMALCHELAHLKRADLWFGCVPALAERVFFFHPLVHLASREYALAREAACDAAVMDTLDAAPQEYGRLLLSLGVSRPRTGLAAAGAWSFLNLKRRIAMLQDVSARSHRSRLIAAGVVGLAVAAMVPMQLAARPESRRAAAKANAAAQRAALDAERGLAPAALEAGESELVEAGQAETERRKTGGLTFVLMLEDGQQTTSGSPEDVKRAARNRHNGEPLLWFRYDGREYVIRDPELLRQARTLWSEFHESGFKRDELGAWVDALKSEKFQKHDELRAFTQALKAEDFQKHDELRAFAQALKAEEFQKHDELRAFTQALKSEDFQKHARLAAEAQSLLGAHLGATAADQAKLDAHLGMMFSEKALQALTDARDAISGIELEELERLKHSLDEVGKEVEEKMREGEQRLKSDLDSQMHELRQQLDKIEEPMREMAAPLEEFGHRMESFGRSMERAARKANDEMRALLERAIAAGLAQTVR
jgi:bla regulator protein blaR1